MRTTFASPRRRLQPPPLFATLSSKILVAVLLGAFLLTLPLGHSFAGKKAEEVALKSGRFATVEATHPTWAFCPNKMTPMRVVGTDPAGAPLEAVACVAAMDPWGLSHLKG